MSQIKTVLFDFDGTLTAVESTVAPFLAAYRERFVGVLGAGVGPIWDEHLASLRAGSPSLAWMLCGFEACPVDADPYILASETATRTLASVGKLDGFRGLSGMLYQELYKLYPAPFRPEAAGVIKDLVERGVKVAVVSNASTGKIEERLDGLLTGEVRKKVRVFGDAQKFLVGPASEPNQTFEGLPALVAGPGRPMWIKRGRFFDALVRGFDGLAAEEVLFVGDIYELDLILPARLGCAVQLVARVGELETHDYEKQAVLALPNGGFSKDLTPILSRV